MPLHIITKVSELVPEAGALVKRASLEQNLPTGTKEETILSALELDYMIKVAHTTVDVSDAERVCRAVDLYDVADEVRNHSGNMIKAASEAVHNNQESKTQVSQAESLIESQLSKMSPDFEKVAEACESLWDNYSDMVSNDEVKRYAGAGTLVKEAALLALKYRASRTGNSEFEKVAEVIASTDVNQLSTEDNRAIINSIRGLEKEASYIESNLYTDMFITKEAAVMVNLGGNAVDATNLVKIAEHAGAVLGSDIGSLLSDAHSNKSAIEALPLGERQVISGLAG